MTDKLQELMLYIARRSTDDQSFGYTKLNKILFFSDFYAYGELGDSITGAVYVHNHKGPTPKYVKPAEAALSAAGRAFVEERQYYGHPQKRLIAIVEPDMSRFTSEQINIVDRVINECRHLTGSQLSDLTHELQPWRNSVEGEEIPYYTVFTLRRVPVGYEDRIWAQQTLDELTGLDPAELEPIEVDA